MRDDDFFKDFNKDASVFIRKSIIWYLVAALAILVAVAALGIGTFWVIHKIVTEDSNDTSDPIHHQTDRSNQEPLRP